MSDTAAPRPPLVAEVLSGKNRDLQLLAAQGILPLPQEELPVFYQDKLVRANQRTLDVRGRIALAVPVLGALGRDGIQRQAQVVAHG